MYQILLMASLLMVISCGEKSSSSKKNCTLNNQSVNCSTFNAQNGSQATESNSGEGSIFTFEGLKNLGLAFEEVGHRTSEYQYSITCTDNVEFTNFDRLNNLTDFLKNLAKSMKEKPKAKYRVYCNQGLDKCLLSGSQMQTLTKEAIKTLNYYSVLLPSKYCPNSNLTPNGIVVPNNN